MFSAIHLIFRNASLRIATIALFITGFTYAATIPFQSIVAIKEFGMSDGAFSLLTIAIALANLTIGVSLSIVSDMVKDRRSMIIGVCAIGILGFGLVYLFPSLPMFAICSITLISISSTSYVLLFGAVRSTTNSLDSERAAAVNTIVRAVFSASWILVPGLVAFLLVGSVSMLPAWGFAAIACLVSLVLVLAFWPATSAPVSEQKFTFFSSVRQLMSPIMIGRITAMALITGTQRLFMIVAPLIIVGKVGGTLADVGLVFGTVAALEIPFMLMWGSLVGRFSVLQILVTGTVIYSAQMALLSFATAPWHVYALMVPAACGAAAILTLPLTYFQDLLTERPGLGTSLFQITAFVSYAFVSVSFAIGAATLGYSHTAWMSVVMAALGIAGLLALERQKRSQAYEAVNLS